MEVLHLMLLLSQTDGYASNFTRISAKIFLQLHFPN